MSQERTKRFDWRDALGLAGVALLTYGAWLIYRPAGFLVAGALLTAAAVASARQ